MFIRASNLILVFMLAACGAPTPDTPQMSSGKPAEQVPASPETGEMTGGVINWKVVTNETEEGKARLAIDGDDKNGETIQKLVIEAEQVNGEVTRVTVESVFPEQGRLVFTEKGDLLENTLPPSAGMAFEAVANDLAAKEGGVSTMGWWGCTKAVARTIWWCGWGTYNCVRGSDPLSCLKGKAPKCADGLRQIFCNCFNWRRFC